MGADRIASTVRQILASAARAAPAMEAEIAHANAADVFEQLDRMPLDFGPDARDLGAFEVAGQRQGDLLSGRRIAVGGKVYRVLIWVEV